jgi:hypothetical protein
MLPPQDDVAARTPVWEALQMIFMDTDPAELLDEMAEACARSPYEIGELEQILFQEVLPACRNNLFLLPAPEWQGFATNDLVALILRKHRFGGRRPFVMRGYTRGWWEQIEPRIRARRASADATRGSTNER